MTQPWNISQDDTVGTYVAGRRVKGQVVEVGENDRVVVRVGGMRITTKTNKVHPV